MRKLTLSAEDLHVESFVTDPATRGDRGTVLGRQQTWPTVNGHYYPCDQPSNWGLDATCYDSCYADGNCTNVCGSGGTAVMVCETGNCPTGPYPCYTIDHCE